MGDKQEQGKRKKRMSRKYSAKVPLAILALAVCTGTVHASASLVANPTSLSLACDTVLGPTPATIGLTLATGAVAATVSVSAPSGNPLVLPSSASVSSTSSPTNFSISIAAGCKGATNNQVVVITFTPNTGTALTVNATLTVTNSASALAPSPTAVTLTCTKSGNNYSPGPNQTVTVTSPANGGTPFTVDNTTNVLPSWLNVSPLGGGTANSTGVALTVSAKSGCGGLPAGSTTFSVHLLNAPAPDKLLPVTIQVGAAATLSASPNPVSLTYTTGTTPSSSQTVAMSASPAAFFAVNPATVPVWLNVTPTTGTTSSPVSVHFTVTAGAETLAPGSYTANVHFQVSGALDYVVPVNLAVSNPAATLSTAEGITRNLNWTIGTPLPSLIITALSSDAPIGFAVTTTANTLNPQVSITSGLAYNFGTPISVSFLQSVFGAAAPGTTLSGIVTLTPNGGGSAVNVTINVAVQSPGAQITTLSPASLPTAGSGSFMVAVSGTGFVASGGSSVQTNVGIVTGGLIVADSNLSVSLINSNSMVLTITVPSSADPLLPFSGNGGTVTIGACNPQGGTCSTPTSTLTLTIGVNPMIRSISSGASYIQATPPALTSVAPYDILSIFGTNFCVSGGTGCQGQSAILYGVLNPVTLAYQTAVSPDPSGATQRNVTVTFQTHGTSPTVIANAPILFATDNQINVVVPSAVSTYVGNTVDVVVSFGYGSGATMLKSAPFSVSIAATDPGVYTIGGDGQGDAAALSPAYSVISSTNPANSRSVGADSDVIQLYVSGLGAPDASATYGSSTCMPPANYFAAVNTATGVSPALASDDGLVIQYNLLPSGNLPPCVKTNQPSVTIGGITATVQYAGWVAGSVAGLYQINVLMPASGSNFTDASGTPGALTGTARYLPVVITSGGKTSQPSGVAIWAAQTLLPTYTGPASGTNGHAWGTASVSTQDGTGPYTFALGTGTFPAGMTLDSSSGAIAGSPTTPGTYTFTVNVTDSNSIAGSVSITLTVN